MMMLPYEPGYTQHSVGVSIAYIIIDTYIGLDLFDTPWSVNTIITTLADAVFWSAGRSQFATLWMSVVLLTSPRPLSTALAKGSFERVTDSAASDRLHRAWTKNTHGGVTLLCLKYSSFVLRTTHQCICHSFNTKA